MDFFEKEDYTFKDIEDLIKNEIEESVYLDFKSNLALEKTDGKRAEISKDIAAFANSDGGIIVYGIKEENHKASHLSFIDGNVYTKEWLEQIINSSIQKRISNIKIFPLRNNNIITETIYIVKIPRSINTPHMSKDKRYYKRYNFESVAMEEYEIRELFNREEKTELVLESFNVKHVKSTTIDYVKLIISITILNVGKTLETTYKVNTYISNVSAQLSFGWDKIEQSNHNYTWMEDNKIKISCVGIIPIYANESVTVSRFAIEFHKDFLQEALNDIVVETRLLYKNGIDTMETTLDNIRDKLLALDENDLVK